MVFLTADGYLSKAEFRTAVQSELGTKKRNKQLRQGLVLVCLAFMLLCGAMLGISIGTFATCP